MYGQKDSTSIGGACDLPDLHPSAVHPLRGDQLAVLVEDHHLVLRLARVLALAALLPASGLGDLLAAGPCLAPQGSRLHLLRQLLAQLQAAGLRGLQRVAREVPQKAVVAACQEVPVSARDAHHTPTMIDSTVKFPLGQVTLTRLRLPDCAGMRDVLQIVRAGPYHHRPVFPAGDHVHSRVSEQLAANANNNALIICSG